MKLRILALFALLLSQPALAATTPEATRVVLPTDVAPQRYDIRITPNARTLTFEGHERVVVTVRRPTDRIVLNAADIDFRHVALSGARTPKIVLDDAQQTAAFIFDRRLEPGRYELSIDYDGRIYQQSSGLFALDYDAPGGARQRALYTQFENSDARRFAPSWDEPGVKAVFSLTVVAPADQMAISNMPVAVTLPLSDGRQAVRFADTPKMSVYLLFLGLGDFERIHQQVGPTDVGVIVRRGDTAKGAFALDAAVKLLGYYNDYFATPYPLPKLDLIAAPGRSHFFAAMENWGAIFYFDYALLLDPKFSTESDRQAVFVTVAHEMAHQWFGDLVTMAWWDDLWLNEGFASWMENKATDHLHPEWHISRQAKAGEQAAMRFDAQPNAHAVIAPIHDVFAANDAFNSITYQKGQAVIRMLESYVGEDVFRAGVRAYIADHAYGNTVTDDLWAELDRVSPRKITDIAHDFTLQSGVPLITATHTPTGLELTQSRFATGPGAARTWRTPVVVGGLGAPQQVVVSAAPLDLPAAAEAAPLLNAGETGYFRSAYAPELWRALVAGFPALPAVDQLGPIYDSLALGEAGAAPMSNFLEICRQAGNANDPIVVETLAQQMLLFDTYYDGQPGQAAWRAFARAQLAAAFARVGWEARPGEVDNDAVLRRTLISALGRFDDPAVVAEAKRRFAAFLVHPESLSGAQRRAVLQIVAVHADPGSWDALHALARIATDVSDKGRLYSLLGASLDEGLSDRALALAMSGEPSTLDAPRIVEAVSDDHPAKAFAFAVAHRAALETMLEPASRVSFFADIAGGANDADSLARATAFAATVPPSTRGEVERAVNEIQYRQKVIETRLPEVDRWLADHPG